MYAEIANSISALIAELVGEDNGVFPTEEHGLMLVQNEIRDFIRSGNGVSHTMAMLLDKYSSGELRKSDYMTLRIMAEMAASEAIYTVVLTERIRRLIEDRDRRATQEELEKFWEDR